MWADIHIIYLEKNATDCGCSILRTKKNDMNLNIRLQTMTVSQYKDHF